jgi:hypothetical protein
MSTTGKVKLYKNSFRNKPEQAKPYIPQYQLLGIEPQEWASQPKTTTPMAKKVPLSSDNPRAPRPLIRQPYGEGTPSPVGRGKGLLPNVGNNVEQTWSSLDGQIIDDMELDSNHQMVDNNEFVSARALGLPEVEETMEVVEEQSTFPVADTNATQQSDSVIRSDTSFLQELEEGEYILLLQGEPVVSGSLSDVQEHVRDLVFGEHTLCKDNPVPITDIVVLQRTKIKVGVFLDE